MLARIAFKRKKETPYTTEGVDGTAVDVEVLLGQDLGALVDSSSRSIKDSTKHVLGDTKLQALAGELDLGLFLS